MIGPKSSERGAATNLSSPSLSIENGVATIVLNRPAQRNRLENADLAVLLQHFAQVDADSSVRVLVLTANTHGQHKPVFCAGYDISGFDEDGAEAVPFERVADALAELRPITVCALNGSVYGGATDLFLACDLRMALAGVEFRMPANALGLHYYPSGLRRYVASFGLSFAKRAFLTARALTVEQLWKTGCLEGLAPIGDFDRELQRLIQDVACLAPLAAQSTKASLNEISVGVYDVERLRAREMRAANSLDFAEGRRAFQERRQPLFLGQ